jgi:hypothetical protein
MNKLLDHPTIERLHRESRVTLTDLIDRKLFIEPPEEPCGHIPPSAWFLCYQEDLVQAESERLRAARKRNPRLILAAALVVAGATGKLSKQQGYMAFDFTRYVEAHEYELEQLVRSEGGKNSWGLSADERQQMYATCQDEINRLCLERNHTYLNACKIVARNIREIYPPYPETRSVPHYDTIRGNTNNPR